VLDKLDVHAVTDVRQVLELALAPAMSDATPEVPVAAMGAPPRR
jgi:ATP-dependent Lon protease